ncbi:hypothetical protein VHEMI08479 [[Torrubiella] hemipterigena]|uniref:Long chronological lifespan protein 2 n=1 Tax=[Torrubiella] hemipterigena TaxID=1531966 RepID=A0A0A1T6V1_9HYPO|nr:hypothetical protein VHEMI08479 [[Torrubiella] hemipterigena]
MRLIITIISMFALAQAQFGFFDQMFGGGQEQHHQHQGHGHGHGGNVPSDANMYRQRYDQSPCDNYLCPDTLACVHFPHHCPCAWDANDEKFELGEGKRICASKGGFKDTETARKVELARKGLL